MTKQRVLDVIPQRCTGCHSCELMCSFYKEKEFDLKRSRIRVVVNEAMAISIPAVCMQCTDAPCMAVCPTAALQRDHTTGAVLVNEAKCIGCRMCSLGCPFGAVHFHTAQRVVIKCDLCQGEPQCVRVCAPQALRFVDREKAGSVQLRKTTDRLAEQIARATLG